jgi:hypothetical protein
MFEASPLILTVGHLYMEVDSLPVNAQPPSLCSDRAAKMKHAAQLGPLRYLYTKLSGAGSS